MSRRAAALLGSGLLLGGVLVGASPAVADEAARQGGAAASLNGLTTFDQVTIHERGEDSPISAGLFEMSVDDGGTLQTYSIDIHNPTQDGARYQEVPWSQSSLHDNEDAGRIHWILRNSYPQLDDLAALARAAGAEQLTPRTAAAGTQVAIWRYSDGVDVTANDVNAEKLADYLHTSAKNVEQPAASLSLEPTAVSGKSGERLGPVTVRTNAQAVTVSPREDAVAQGVTVVDEDGAPVITAKNGAELYVEVPKDAEPGSTSLTVQAATEVPVGRAFTGVGQHAKSQAQILAGSSESTVAATASASWADKGAIPAVSAQKNCAQGGVDVTATNQGDEPFRFSLAGQEYAIEPGGSETVTVPVKEDQPYAITITGPNDFTKTFTGVLDCQTTGSAKHPPAEPTPATVGGGHQPGADELAETGSSSDTPVIAGIAVLLVVVGAGTMLLMRRRKPTGSGSEE